MSELTMQLGYEALQREVGYQLNWTRNVASYDAQKLSQLDDLINSGYHRFLQEHKWSFMEPLGYLTTVSGQGDYDLPPEFAATRGMMRYPTGNGWGPIEWVNEAYVMDRRSAQSTSGRPYAAAIRPKPHDPKIGQRFELIFWPNPDGAYRLNYRYRARPIRLSPDNPMPLGGPEHGEVILASILALMELRVKKAKGQNAADYDRLLAQSIRFDRQQTTPDSLGQGRELDEEDNTYWRHRGTHTVTVNGATV